MAEHIHQQAGPVAVDRIRKIKQLIESFDSGDVNAIKTLSDIGEVAGGNDHPIVRVGGQHTPELQTERAPARGQAAQAHRHYTEGNPDAVTF